jgi:metallo-beta-lactamase family protein
VQEFVYYIRGLVRDDRIPSLMVFVDSPMAIRVTEVFKRYTSYFDDETKERIDQRDSPFEFHLLTPTRTTEESKAINHIKGTSIILAGSGMCTGGRVKHHLVNNITRKESTLLFVGYQARGTLGRHIIERPASVRILGREYAVQARIEKINGFSAHADKDELLRWAEGFEGEPRKVFVVHGEKDASREFAATLRNSIGSEVVVPSFLDEYTI